MLNCKFCAKDCKNANSLRNHERLCKENPEHQTTYFSTPERKLDMRCRTNQFIKAEREGLPKPIVSAITRKKSSDAVLSRTNEWNKENGKRIAKTIAEKVANGTWHTSLAKNMHYDYNGVDLHGSWELSYAMYLDENKIKWVRNKDSFAYVFEGKTRKYTPDFFLVDTKEYVEVKGYNTEKDDAKWTQFPLALKVLMKKDLLELGIKIKL